MRSNLPEWRKEEIEIREESNNRYPKCKNWGITLEDLKRANFNQNEKRVSENIRDVERRIRFITRNIFIKKYITSYKNYIKWMSNQYRCTKKELESSLEYAIFHKKDYNRILSEIRNGFYSKERD